MSAWVFHLRWILIPLGFLAALAWLLRSRPAIQTRLVAAEQFSEARFKTLLTVICGTFFALALAAKLSQLWALELNGMDFWLFEDMLRQAQKGALFLTRFAPQGWSWVQHGAVHATYSWLLALPLSWCIGPTGASLVYGPLVLASAGAVLALLARKCWGSLGALALSAAFLASNHVGKILMYDVHPEAIYPLCVITLLWALFSEDLRGRTGVASVIASGAALIGVLTKEDSFLVFFPLLAWAVFTQRDVARRAALWAALTALIGYGFELLSISRWSTGQWGPNLMDGVSVLIPSGSQILGGKSWSSWDGAQTVVSHLIQSQGGWLESLMHILRFLVSRQWLGLLILIPWVIARRRTWVIVLPLASAYALLESPSKLWLYYSAPFLGLLWGLAVQSPPRRKSLALVGCIFASFVLGGGGIELHWPSEKAKSIRESAMLAAKCLAADEQGFVPSHLISFVPREKVASDRVPNNEDEWKHIRFALFSPGVGRFEAPLEDIQRLQTRVSADPSWVAIDPADCKAMPAHGPSEGSTAVVLYRRAPGV